MSWEGSWHPKGWMEGGWGQPLLRKMHRSSKKQAALAGSVRWGDMQDGGYRQPGPFPALEARLARLTPSPEKQPQVWGEEQARLGLRRLGCLRASQRDGEALVEAQTAPYLPEPSSSHAKAIGGWPQVHQLPPLQADKT